MGRYGLFGGAEDAKHDFQSMVKDLQTVVEHAKTEVGDDKQALPGTIPTADTQDTAKPDLPLRPDARMRLIQLLAGWTGSPANTQNYGSLAAHLPQAGDSDLAKLVREIMIDDDGLVLRYHDDSHCWTLNFTAERRSIVNGALNLARKYCRATVGLLQAGAISEDSRFVFDFHFGPNAASNPTTLQKVQARMTSIHNGIGGVGCPAFTVGPFPGSGSVSMESERDTFAFVRTKSYPANLGAVVFLGESFFREDQNDSAQAATIIHEASHYFANTVDLDEKGTDKGCYGAENAARLAKDHPDVALENADNYAFFAMNLGM